MHWIQVYDPLHSVWLSTLAAAVPILVLLATLGLLEWRAHWSAAVALASALAIAVIVFGMPARAAMAAAGYGAAYGLLPIGWIVVNAVFLYNLTVRTGQFDVLREGIARMSSDRRIQALVIAFSFGAFIEGAAGFGTPVAITAALLIGLGFPALQAAGLSLIANTAPVAFGAIGTPILTLAAVTGLPVHALSAMAGRQLPLISVLIPAWLVVTLSGWRGLKGVWPAVAVSGGSFAIVQFAWSNAIGPELVDIAGGLASLGALALFCTVWRPKEPWEFPAAARANVGARPHVGTGFPGLSAVEGSRSGQRTSTLTALMPWIVLSIFVLAWGLPTTKTLLSSGPSAAARFWRDGTTGAPDARLSPTIGVPGLDRMVYREYPVERDAVDRARVSDPAYQARRAEAARFTFNWLGATGTAILLAALVSAWLLRMRVSEVARVAGSTARQMRPSLATIALMLALGFVTATAAPTPRSASRSRGPARSIRSSPRCSAGSASP